MKFFKLLISLLVFNFSLTQVYEIKWEKEKSLQRYENDVEIYPYFSNFKYSLYSTIPIVGVEVLDNQLSNYELINLKWKEIKVEELFSSLPNNVPSQEVWNYSRNNGTINFTVWTLKKENKKYYKLISFEVSKNNYTNKKSAKIKSFSESVLKNGNYYKIQISNTGIHKIDYQFFKNNGLNPEQINPKNIKIYGNGGEMLSERIDNFRYEDLQENAIEVVGESDNKFDTNDYVLFFAQGADSWDRKSSQPTHKKNIYSDYAYYYLKIDDSEGKRVTEQTFGIPSDYFTTYDDYWFYEEEKINISSLGRLWFGKDLSLSSEKINFTIPNINQSRSMIIRWSVGSSNASNNNIKLKLNDSEIDSNPINSNGNAYLTTGIKTFLPNTTTFNFEFFLDNSLNPAGKVYTDYLEILMENNLSYAGNQMLIRKFSNLEDGGLYGFRLNNSNSTVKIWNVSDRTSSSLMKNLSNGSTYDFSYRSNSSDFKNEFIAFTDDKALIPKWIGKISNQNLRGLKDVNYFIITHPKFINQANRLATYHRKNGLNVSIVTPQQIYEEFSSGSQDITAIRDFLRFHYQKDDKKLKYVLLFGDASFDFKDRISNNTNFVPSYQSVDSSNYETSFVTDDYYTILDDGESNTNHLGESSISSREMDIAVGRFAASNEQEAKTAVDKTLKYINQLTEFGSPFGDWRTKIHFVVDDDTINKSSTFHSEMENSISKFIETNFPNYTLRKLYADAFKAEGTPAGQRFPQLNAAIENAIETGSLFVNYFGHGGPSGWAQERILTFDNIRNNSNFNTEFSRFPFLMTVTCDFTIWDNPKLQSGGIMLLKNPNGGVFSALTTSRAIGVAYGLSVNKIYLAEILRIENNQFVPLGEAIRRAKVISGNTEDREVNFFGDPAIPIAKPPRNINITEINGIPINSFSGTIRALDYVKIKGEILNESNSKDTSFNGKVSINLFDKPVAKKTFNNDGDLPILSFNEQINAVYKGSSTVTNGDFTAEFYVPKDINYEIGNAKLVLYADNNKVDALTFKNDLKLGGINPNGINDTTPPVINLFMNNTNFVNGGITDRNPILLACVSDDFGINASGSGVGHDVTAILDGNILGTFVLNEYYTGGEVSPCGNSKLLDFQKGKIAFPLKNLSLGEHEITFKIWDINNNSSTATLKFTVVENPEVEFIVKNLLNWPNPFTDKTCFQFEHNCDAALDTMVQIYTISGKLVKTIRETITSNPIREGYRTNKFAICWDGLDDFGEKIGKGTYLYRLNVQSIDASKCKGSATAIEKLVILK